MTANKEILVLTETVRVQQDDYISLIWEQLNNPDFNRVEFEAVKNESGSNITQLEEQ